MRTRIKLALGCLLALAGCGGRTVCEGFKGGSPTPESPSQQQPAVQTEPSGR
ncbi:MAG: hypothetical protein IT433_11395 [Phycisphaerales bacterium]|nr:hypothetical protein [Phycisphaerales bacterium]